MGAAGPSLSTGHGDLGGWAGALGGLPAEAPGWEVSGPQLGRHPAEALGWEVHEAQLGRHPAEALGWEVRGALDELPGLALGVKGRVAGPPARRAAALPPCPKGLRPTKQYIYSATFNKVVWSETSR